MQRIDNRAEEKYLKATIYGRSGTGKTSLAVTAPSPIILASERQSILSVRQAAKRLGVAEPPVFYMESVEDYRMIVRACKGKRDEPWKLETEDGVVLFEREEWPETVVLDSFSDATRIVRDDIMSSMVQTRGKDGLPTVPMRYWDVLGDRNTNIIKAFRDLEMHTLFLCLADDKESGEGEQKTRTVKPMVPMRTLAEALSAASNVVGYAYRAEVERQGVVGVSYGVMFSGPEHFQLKTCAPLRKRETANFTAWVRAVYEHLEPTDEMPVASYESMQALESKEAPQTEAAAAEPETKKTKTKKGDE